MNYSWMKLPYYPEPPEFVPIEQDNYLYFDEWHKELIEFWMINDIPITRYLLEDFQIIFK